MVGEIERRQRPARQPEQRGEAARPQPCKALVDCSGAAAHLQQHIDALAVGRAQDRRHDILAGVQRVGRAHRAGQGQPARVDIGGEDPLRA